MVKAIADVAVEKSVNLFRRFDLMERRIEVGKYSFEQMVNPMIAEALTRRHRRCGKEGRRVVTIAVWH
jgi:hypothetical protein